MERGFRSPVGGAMSGLRVCQPGACPAQVGFGCQFVPVTQPVAGVNWPSGGLYSIEPWGSAGEGGYGAGGAARAARRLLRIMPRQTARPMKAQMARTPRTPTAFCEMGSEPIPPNTASTAMIQANVARRRRGGAGLVRLRA